MFYRNTSCIIRISNLHYFHFSSGSAKPSILRAKFENLAKQSEEELRKRNESEQLMRRKRDLQEKKEAKEREENRLKLLKKQEEEASIIFIRLICSK